MVVDGRPRMVLGGRLPTIRSEVAATGRRKVLPVPTSVERGPQIGCVKHRERVTQARDGLGEEAAINGVRVSHKGRVGLNRVTIATVRLARRVL